MAASTPPSALTEQLLKFFTDVQDALRRHPALVAEIAAIFQFNVRGGGAWVVDCKTPGGGVRSGTAAKPDCTLEYSSVADFVAINAGKLDLKRAILTGRFKVHGNYKVLQRMHESFERAKKADAADAARRAAEASAAATRARAPSYAQPEPSADAAGAAGPADGAGAASGTVAPLLERPLLTAASSTASPSLIRPPSPSSGGLTAAPPLTSSLTVPSGEWASDSSASSCTRCGAAFTFVRRKHHCRKCGRIYCQTCSSQQLGGQRACDFCVTRQLGLPPPDGKRIADPALAHHHGASFAAPAGHPRASFAASPATTGSGGGDGSAAGSPHGMKPATGSTNNLVDVMARGAALIAAPWTSSSKRLSSTPTSGGAPHSPLAQPAVASRKPSFSLFGSATSAAAAATASATGAGSPPPGGRPPSVGAPPLFASAAPAPAPSAPIPIQGATTAQTHAPHDGGGGGGGSGAVSGRLLQPVGDVLITDHFATPTPPLSHIGLASSASSQRSGSPSVVDATGLASRVSLSAPPPGTTPPLHATPPLPSSSSSMLATRSAVPPSPGRGAGHADAAPEPTTAGSVASSSGPAEGAGGVLALVGDSIGGGSRGAGDGAEGEEDGESRGPDPVAELNDKVAELQARLAELQTSVYAHTCLPEVHAATPYTAVMAGELIAPIIYPLTYGLAIMGWRLVPALLAWWALSSWGSGRYIWSLIYAAAAAAVVYNTIHDTRELFRRRMRIYGATMVTFLDYRLTRWAAATAALDEKDADTVWEAAHRRNAVRAFRIIRDLRGLWVKCGQYLSSRPDVMPPAYIKILAALQDAMPARPLAEVRATIEEDLCRGRPLTSIFSGIQEKALAAASIGQVHKATLVDGTDVAVKVQHRGMDVIIGQDLENLRIILSWLSWVESGFNMEGIMREWLKEVGSELDFEREARNMIEVRDNVMATDLPVTVPRVMPGLYSRRVLVMRFIDGVKVNDLEKLRKLGVNREELCDRVCTAYAHQIYRNGFFNGDPHPGNIMVAKRSSLLGADKGDPEHVRLRRIAGKQREARAMLEGGAGAGAASRSTDDDAAVGDDEWIPVLLDFGLTKRLPEYLRLAFAKLVVSAEEMDFAGMLEAMDLMGMTFSRESAAEDLENLQYMFRNASPASEARAKHEERERVKREKAEKKAAEDAAKGDSGGGSGNGSKKADDRKMTAWPTDLMFYLRASELLQGLCSHLETRHPFMKTMARASRLAFLDRVPLAERAAAPLYPPLPPAATPGMAPAWTSLSPLERLIRVQLMHLRHADAFLGCQVVVFDYHAGRFVASVAAGDRGALDPRPVTPDTLFPVLGASRVAVAAAFAGAVADGSRSVSWDDRIDKYWPAWGAAGKAGCTLGELLRGRSGVEAVLPRDVSTAHFARDRWDDCATIVAEATPLVLPSLIVARHSSSRGASVASRASFLELVDGDGASATAATTAVRTSSAGAGVRSAAAAALLPPIAEDGDAAAGGGAAAAVPSEPLPAIHAAAGAAEGAGAADVAAGSTRGGDDASATDLASPASPPPFTPHTTTTIAASTIAHCFSHGRPLVGPPAPMDHTTHLWFGWGWAVGTAAAGVAKALRLVTAADAPTADGLNVLLAARLGRSQGITGHLRFGFPTESLPPMAAPPTTEDAAGVAVVPTQPPLPPPLNIATVCLGASGAVSDVGGDLPADVSVEPVAPVGAGAGAGASALDADVDVTMANAMAAMEIAEVMTAGGLNELTALTSGGREHFMDPRAVNMLKVKGAVLPALNCYASATGLAKAGAYLATTAAAMVPEIAPGIIDAPASTATSPVAVTARPLVRAHAPGHGVALYDPLAVYVAHNCGLRLVGLHRPNPAGGSSEALHYSAFACAGLGGTMLLVDTTAHLAVAVTVNRLTADHQLTSHIMKMVARELRLGRLADGWM